MRRKSARNSSASKASPEKKEEKTPKKTRRQSRRKKQSSTSESDSDEDIKQEIPCAKIIEKEDQGDGLKIKISVSTPERTSRRLRNKAVEDEIIQETEKPSRRSRRRGASPKNEETEEGVEKKGKGKSKGKHKSKFEQSPQVDEPEIQSGLSENVQVTAQSPLTDNNDEDNIDNLNQTTNDDKTIKDDVRVRDETVDNTKNNSNQNILLTVKENEISDPVKTSEIQKESEIVQQESSELNESKATNSEENSNNQSIETQETDLKSTDTQKLIKDNAIESQEVTESANISETEVIEHMEVKEDIEKKMCKDTKIEELKMSADDNGSSHQKCEIKVEEKLIDSDNKLNTMVLLHNEVPLKNEYIAEQKTEPEIVIDSKVNLKGELIENNETIKDEKNLKNEVIKGETIEQNEINNEENDNKHQMFADENIERPEIIKDEDKKINEIVKAESEVSEMIKREDSDKFKLISNEGNVKSEVVKNEEIHETLKEDLLEKPVLRNEIVINAEKIVEPERKVNIQEQVESTEEVISQTEQRECENIEMQQELEGEQIKDADISEIERELDNNPSELDKKCLPKDADINTNEKRIKSMKWGKSNIALNSFPDILPITLEKIHLIYPDLVLLNETDVKLETVNTQRKRSSSMKVDCTPEIKRSERKVSMDTFDEEESQIKIDTDAEKATVDNIIAMNRKISIVDDDASKLKPPPSPAKNEKSEVLFITNLVRPFTLKQLKELLERTGTIKEDGFWTDRIKSKCYVHYQTVEEAENTRNALHGVHWPIGNGKKLIIDYSTPENLNDARNPPVIIPAPVAISIADISEKENKLNEQDGALKTARSEKSLDDKTKDNTITSGRNVWEIETEKQDDNTETRGRSKEKQEKRRYSRSRHSRSPSSEYTKKKQKKVDEEIVPQRAMDDLFRKTEATPCVYWQPLSPEEIALKQQQRLERMAEHKRRMETQTRKRGSDQSRGAPYRRRY